MSVYIDQNNSANIELLDSSLIRQVSIYSKVTVVLSITVSECTNQFESIRNITRGNGLPNLQMK